MRQSVLLAFSLLSLAACGDDDAPVHHEEGACGDIVDVCHDVDTGTGAIAECHDLGHAGDVAACEPRRDECVALCTAARTDAGSSEEVDAGSHHEDVDGGPPDLCDELGSLCHAYDTGSGPAHECHEVGHAGDLAACQAVETMCRATCSGDAGAHDH
ncbi:hypothetical protein [Sandaracinus amylolyticus]|uniref:Lipoprotein n=1 Tax=Sandaracinus amylolyticus TaxID=927083 RepID=A0A0F6W6N5_9BACT|nr:hypothetical protein [Sandaracinus amylolyticus]AKF08627.1 hypothetical protein DB32_005776 [Sandaracinus amylolyticus]